MGEREELASDGARPSALASTWSRSSRIGSPSAGRRGQLGVPLDRRQQIVEVVDNPAGELTDGLQALGLDHWASMLRLPSLADVQHRSDEDASSVVIGLPATMPNRSLPSARRSRSSIRSPACFADAPGSP